MNTYCVILMLFGEATAERARRAYELVDWFAPRYRSPS